MRNRSGARAPVCKRQLPGADRSKKRSRSTRTKALLEHEGARDAITIPCDLFDPKAAQSLYQTVKGKGIDIDVLVNNAGQGQYGLFAESDLARLLSIMQLNNSSLVSLTYYFIQDFIRKGNGKILNLSSVAAKAPGPWQAVYHATKAFVHSFTEALRSEVKEHGITVTALLPGATRTDFFNKAHMMSSKITQDMSKLADPADVAKDGYTALTNGDDMVISGWDNKIQVAVGNLTPDENLADYTRDKQSPVK
ncbi:MAG: SDR family NAD(P)-dependent oxidoreductase [Chitinophagaceae bacterium]